MKRKPVASLICVTVICFFINGIVADEQPQKKVMNFLAVMNLNCGTVLDKNGCAALTDVIIDELVKIKKYSVIDRANRDKILAEAGFQQTGCVDDSCTIEMGRQLGVGKMVVGSVAKIGQIYLVTLQLLDVETGTVELSEKEVCNKCQIDDLIEIVIKLTRKLMGETYSPNPLGGAQSQPNVSDMDEKSKAALQGDWYYYDYSQYGRWHGIWSVSGDAGTFYFQDAYQKKKQDALKIISCNATGCRVTRTSVGPSGTQLYTYDGVFKADGKVFEDWGASEWGIRLVKNTGAESSLDGIWKMTETSKWGKANATLNISGGKGSGAWIWQKKTYVNDVLVIPRTDPNTIVVFRDNADLSTCTYWGEITSGNPNAISGTFACTFWYLEIGKFKMVKQ